MGLVAATAGLHKFLLVVYVAWIAAAIVGCLVALLSLVEECELQTCGTVCGIGSWDLSSDRWLCFSWNEKLTLLLVQRLSTGLI